MFKIHSLRNLRHLERPIAVIVPKTVATIVAIIATETDTHTADIIWESFINSVYHLREKPANFEKDFDELKENIIVMIIGTYKKAKHKSM